MLPTLRPGQIIVATGRYRTLRPDDIVVVYHDGLEKIKRITALDDRRIFIVGDNAQASTDSRMFGWLPATAVQGKIIWPVMNITKSKRSDS
ncbi:MAG TPA: S26 family signal peptidase [Candidatus Saccharimonadales bacterium]|nr:S26 family signal peptidase [Candidatus Saccharimonadales bacterium]